MTEPTHYTGKNIQKIYGIVWNDTMENRITVCHLAAFLVLLPFDRFYSSLLLISLLIHTIIHLTKERILNIFQWRMMVVAGLYILFIIGLIWSSDKKEGLKDAERQLAILLFPLIFFSAGIIINRYRKILLVIFASALAITILYLYVDALRIILYNKLPLKSILTKDFVNHNFSAPIRIHATYFSLYISLALLSILYYYLSEQSGRKRIVFLIILTILLAGLIQLASKSVLIATVVAIGAGVLFVPKAKLKSSYITVLLALLLVIIFGITRVDSFRYRFFTQLKTDLGVTEITQSEPDPRIVRWQSAISVFKQYPIIGHGSGSEKRLLKERYFENRLYKSFLSELNAHNQYLSLLIKYGIVGLLIYLAIILTGLRIAWKKRDFIFTVFLILILIAGFSENILDVNKGVFFYAFFFSFFMLDRNFTSKN